MQALRERQQVKDRPERRGSANAMPRGQIAAPHLAHTSMSAPVAESATSFFQWIQEHLDDPDAVLPPPAEPAAAGADTGTDAEAEDVTAQLLPAAAPEADGKHQPLLRDMRSRSDITHDVSASCSAATAAPWGQTSKVAAAAGACTAPPADLLVQSHLQRHLSLVRNSSGGSSGIPPPAPSTSDATAAAAPDSGMPPTVASHFDHPPCAGRGAGTPTNDVDGGRADLPPGDDGSASPEKAVSAPGRPSVSVSFTDAGAAGGAEWAPPRSRQHSGVDPFPLYSMGRGDRLYSVVLAATRRERQINGGAPRSDEPSAGSRRAGDAEALEEIAAVAQVEWGLRRWRQIAKRVAPAPRSDGGGSATAEALPEDVKQARHIAELALRLRGVSM